MNVTSFKDNIVTPSAQLPQQINIERRKINYSALDNSVEFPKDQLEKVLKKVKREPETITDTQIYNAIFNRETSLEDFIKLINSHEQLKEDIDFLIWSPNYFEGASSCTQWAFKAKRPDFLKYLLIDMKANVNSLNLKNETLVFQAINSYIDSSTVYEERFYGNMAKDFIALKADLNIPNIQNETILESVTKRFIKPNELPSNLYSKLVFVLKVLKYYRFDFSKASKLINLELKKDSNSEQKIERINDLLRLIKM